MEENSNEKITAIKKLLYSFQVNNVTKTHYEKIAAIIKESMKSSGLLLCLYNDYEKLEIKGRIGFELLKISKNIIEDTIVKEIIIHLKKQAKLIIEEGKNYPSLFAYLNGTQKYSIIILLPIIFQNNLIGILALAYKEKYTPTSDEMEFLELIIQIISNNLGNITYANELEKRVNELTEITKSMRHDFANDIQSIALATELLSIAQLSIEEQKFIKILNNAKNSLVEKITKMKELKQKFEKSIEFGIKM